MHELELHQVQAAVGVDDRGAYAQGAAGEREDVPALLVLGAGVEQQRVSRQAPGSGAHTADRAFGIHAGGAEARADTAQGDHLGVVRGVNSVQGYLADLPGLLREQLLFGWLRGFFVAPAGGQGKAQGAQQQGQQAKRVLCFHVSGIVFKGEWMKLSGAKYSV